MDSHQFPGFCLPTSHTACQTKYPPTCLSIHTVTSQWTNLMGPSMSYHLPRSCVTLAIVACYGSFVPSLYLLTPFICVRIHCLPYSFKIFFLHLFTSSIFFFFPPFFFSIFSLSFVSLFCIYFYFIPFLPSVLATPLFFHLLFVDGSTGELWRWVVFFACFCFFCPRSWFLWVLFLTGAKNLEGCRWNSFQWWYMSVKLLGIWWGKTKEVLILKINKSSLFSK